MSTNYDDSERRRIDPAEWISQAEAADLRGVTRQAISKLVKRGRLRSLNIGGHTLVSRTEVETFESRRAGRPPAADTNERG